jgi:phenylacetate-CoA ligase
MARPEREALQLERLKRAVAYVYERVPPYRRKLDEAGLTPASVRSLADLRRLPFTVKDDFHDSYPYGLFAVPLNQVVRVHSSSGTIAVAGHGERPYLGGGHRAARHCG